MPRSSRRKSTPVSPVKSKSEATPPRQTRKAARTRTREPGVAAGTHKEHADRALDAVEEERDTILVRDAPTARENPLPHEISAVEHDGQQPGASRRLPSIRASIYDDIARANHEIESDTEPAIKNLTELNFRADEILSQIDLYSTTQVLEHLGDHQSQAWHDFSEDATSLERQRQHYCADTDFLQIDDLVRNLAAHDLPTKGAAYVYMKANVALFFYRLIEAHPVELHNLLITLSSLQTFPEIFSSIMAPGTVDAVSYDEKFQHQTTSLGLDVLTQSFIFRVKRSARNQKLDYAGTLKDVFTDDEGQIRDVSLGSSSGNRSGVYTKSVREAMSGIMRVISKKTKISSNIAALEESYPWTAFIEHALAWVRVRVDQLNDDIQRAGGVRAIKYDLQRSSVQPGPRTTRKGPRASKADEEFAGKVSFLKNIEDDLDAGEADSQQDEDEHDQEHEIAEAGPDVEDEPAEEAEALSRSDRVLREIIPKSVPESPQTHERHQDASQSQDQDQSNLVNDDEPEEEEIPDSAQSPSIHSVIKPTPATTTVLRNLQRQTKEGNKENNPPARPVHVTGRQPTAPRATSATPAQTQTVDKGKRRREDDISEDSEDDEDDFESDRRHAKHPRPDVSRTGARHNQPTNSTTFLADTVERTDHSPSHIHKHPPSSTQPAPHRSVSSQPHSNRLPSSTAPPPSSYEAYQHAHRNARSNTILATSLAPTPTFPRPPQTRRPWTAPEIERLLYLMRQYGCAWSTIKKADDRMDEPQLSDRSQVQLKDKARNMKLDFLKAEMELPGELVAVTISKGHKEMLRGMNIAFPGEENEE